MYFILLLSFILNCDGCSDFQFITSDSSVICGRSMDFIIPMKSSIVVFNREEVRASTSPDGGTGLVWISKYGFIGINAFHINNVDEGMNEKGLSCSILVLNETKYPANINGSNNISLAIMDICIWILGNFVTVNDVYLGIKTVRIWGNVLPIINVVLGLHIAIHDSQGNNGVIEFIDGNVMFYDNQLGVLTNDPSFPYHLYHLGLYNKLSPYTPSDSVVNGYKIISAGGGMEGIPGSWSSIDRFIRISTILRYQIGQKTALNGVLSATYILNSVYIPLGVSAGLYNGYNLYITTRWTSIKDLTNRIFYFRNNDGTLRAIYFDNINFTKNTKHKSLPINPIPVFMLNVTNELFLTLVN
jgi:choloylglycine hydrolase